MCRSWSPIGGCDIWNDSQPYYYLSSISGYLANWKTTLCRINGIKQIYSGVRCVTTNSKKLHNSGAASFLRPKSRITRTIRGHSFPRRCSKQMQIILKAENAKCVHSELLAALQNNNSYIEKLLDIKSRQCVLVASHHDCQWMLTNRLSDHHPCDWPLFRLAQCGQPVDSLHLMWPRPWTIYRFASNFQYPWLESERDGRRFINQYSIS